MGRWFKSKKERREGRTIAGIEAFNAQLKAVKKPTLHETVSFKHSGHLGDIIWSIPAMLSLASGRKINLFLQTNLKIDAAEKTFTVQAFAMLKPLLEAQSYINATEIYSEQPIDYDLDLFRNLPVNYNAGCLPRYWFYVFNCSYDLSLRWITQVPLLPDLGESIVVSRSLRNRNPTISYQFLSQYEAILFIGTDEEFSDFNTQVSKAKHVQVSDFLQMATFISSAKLFIGNQSFPSALAEAMKVKRILEIPPETPVTIPHGADGYDFYFQIHLEELVRKLAKNS